MERMKEIRYAKRFYHYNVVRITEEEVDNIKYGQTDSELNIRATTF
jgi:hypothetical protein